ncbi:hypothetical protein P7D72_11340 [Enterococcus avium]|uniref:hypothetical protein n=1 Tax=Enterococcus avium TaxID=33945 RepID=UPI00288E3659|nr:hypothetical protein [Enterococcus avium]MDT2492668.1 hypothetical protein [Enterococcus avium]
MLVITYAINNSEKETTYPGTDDFVAAQLKEVPEVPDLPDFYHVVKATVDSNEIALKDKTISGLFNYLNK